jgi:hypothetical protein
MIAASPALPKPPGLNDFPRPFTLGGHQAEKITIPILAWRQAFTFLGACPGRPGADTTSAPGIDPSDSSGFTRLVRHGFGPSLREAGGYVMVSALSADARNDAGGVKAPPGRAG